MSISRAKKSSKEPFLSKRWDPTAPPEKHTNKERGLEHRIILIQSSIPQSLITGAFTLY